MEINPMAANLAQRRGAPAPAPAEATPEQVDPAQIIEGVKGLLVKAVELLSTLSKPQGGA
jgi:hypothetical protein